MDNGSERRFVLIIEDDLGVQRMMERILMHCGYDVLVAADGAEALDALEAFGDSLSAVLLDLKLPCVPGEIVLAYAHGGWPKLPVVVTTGATEARASCDLAAASMFLAKPFHIDELVDTIRAVTAA